MKSRLFVIVVIPLAVLFFGSITASAQAPDIARPHGVQKNIDLAVDLKVKVLSKTNDYSGRIRLIGTVKNVGKLPYQSKPNQQMVYIYQTDAAGNVTKTLAKKNVSAAKKVIIKPGQEILLLQADMNWSHQEFGPGYKISIVFDPDIAADGNTANDDQNSANNEKYLSHQAIDKIFKSQNPAR